MVYNIEIIVREAARRRIRADSEHCRITEYASNDWTYSFNDGMGWDRPLLRVTRADHVVRVIVQEHRGPWHCDVYFNGVRILDTVGGLENRQVGIQVHFDVEKGKPTLIEMVRRSLKGEGENWLTYYAPMGGSFGVVGGHHMKLLPQMGWNVHHVLLDDLLKRYAGTGDPWGLVHPIFYVFQMNRRPMQGLRRGHTHVGGFDLADTDQIAAFAAGTANQMDLIMVPSECSRSAYIRSGVKSRVEVVPHGVGPLYSAPRNPSPRVPQEGVKILFFFAHSPLRKGADIVRKVMSRVLKERPEARFVLKTGGHNELCMLPKTTVITQWLSELDLVRLYDACDILIAPSRGGGFELNVLEALARGLVVITSDWGAIQEYAGKYALTVRSEGRIKPLPGNHIHVGYGANLDLNDCYAKVNYALDNLESLKKRAIKNAPGMRRKYSWKNTVRRIAECLR